MAKNPLGSVALVGLGLVALATTTAGCGDDANNLAQFTGIWMYTASQGTLACPGQQVLMGTLGTSKQWSEGISSDLVDRSPLIFDSTISCYFNFDVSDKIATIQAGQTCSFSDGAGGFIPDVPTAWKFTLTSATTADETLTLTVDTTCTLTGSGTLKKVAKN